MPFPVPPAKAISLALAAVCMSALCACTGRDEPSVDAVTAEFLKERTGLWIDGKAGNSLSFAADGATTFERTGPASANPTATPDSTPCKQRHAGALEAVIRRSIGDRELYLDFATHEILVKVQTFRTFDVFTSPTPERPLSLDCFLFETQKQSSAPFYVRLYAELLSKDSIRLHVSGRGDYVKGGPRTPSTLDEVYERDGVPKANSAAEASGASAPRSEASAPELEP